jgi:hypothetical protein
MMLALKQINPPNDPYFQVCRFSFLHRSIPSISAPQALKHPVLNPLNATPLQRLQQLRPSSQTLLRPPIPHPTPNPFVTLRPNIFLLIHQPIEELIRSFRRRLAVLFDLCFCALLRDRSQVSLDGHVDAGFFPGFAGRCFDFALVRFPTAFGQDPAFARGGLD